MYTIVYIRKTPYQPALIASCAAKARHSAGVGRPSWRSGASVSMPRAYRPSVPARPVEARGHRRMPLRAFASRGVLGDNLTRNERPHLFYLPPARHTHHFVLPTHPYWVHEPRDGFPERVRTIR